MLEKKTVWVILRSSVLDLPPVFSLLQALMEIPEYNVCFISTNHSNLNSEKGKFTEYILESKKNRSKITKLLDYIRFRIFCLRILKKIAKPNDSIWLASLDTAITLKGSQVLKQIPYVLQLHELYDTFPLRRKIISNIAKNAKNVITPELNRSAILKVWLNLKNLPLVIPNKPYNQSRKKYLTPTIPETKKIINENWSDGKFIILYQGHIGGDRNLFPLARAMKKFPEMELWLMGQDHGHAKMLTGISENIKFLGHVPAPFHLEITSYGAIGIMNYDPINLNNIYCAPNKIWEYSGFNIPFISNAAPPLINIKNEFSSGEVIEFNTDEICKAINKIKSNLAIYEKNSQIQHDSVDLKSCYIKALIIN